MHALDAAFDQSEQHGARRAAGAQHQRILGLVPSGRAGVEIVDKAFDVGVGRAHSPSSNHSVLAAPTARARASGFDSASALFLVREGDVGAGKAAQRKPEHEILELIRRHGLDDIAARDAERPQPVTMDQRRARMRSRPSDQARGGGSGSLCHDSQFGQAGVGVNAGASGRPLTTAEARRNLRCFSAAGLACARMRLEMPLAANLAGERASRLRGRYANRSTQSVDRPDNGPIGRSELDDRPSGLRSVTDATDRWSAFYQDDLAKVDAHRITRPNMTRLPN